MGPNDCSLHQRWELGRANGMVLWPGTQSPGFPHSCINPLTECLVLAYHPCNHLPRDGPHVVSGTAIRECLRLCGS